MNERFDAPPLVEIIAELRWDIGSPRLPNGMAVPIPILPQAAQTYEASFTRFAQALGELGFHNSERIVPPGFPWMVHEPVMRYRFSGEVTEADELKASSLFQVGAGIFTANAVPPYSSWEEFGPIVKQGIEALLAHGMPDGKISEVAPTLRYIDAFRSNLTNGETLHQFASRVMGIHVELPDALKGVGPTQIPVIQVVKQLEFGSLLVQIADGMSQNDKALIVEMVVQFSSNVPAETEVIFEALSKARDEIHTVFVSITKPIHEAMQQKGVQA